MKNKKTKKYHGWRNASILFGVIFTAIGLITTAFFGPRDEGLTAVSLLLTMLSLLIGAMLYLIYVGKIKGAKLSFIALGLELAGPILWLICWIVSLLWRYSCYSPSLCCRLLEWLREYKRSRKQEKTIINWVNGLRSFLYSCPLLSCYTALLCSARAYGLFALCEE